MLFRSFWNTVNTELKSVGIPQTPSAPDPAKPNVVNPDGITQLRWVVAHVPFITPTYIELSKRLGVGLSVLGGWRWLSGTPTSNGPPFRSILEGGAHAGMSSDGMQISVMDPWAGMYYAVTGKNVRGELINSGQTTVASLSTSANRPPSRGDTNFPHEMPSWYVQPLSPPQ